MAPIARNNAISALTLLHEQRQHSGDHEHGDEQSDAAERAADRDQSQVGLGSVEELGATSLIASEHRDVVTERTPQRLDHVATVRLRSRLALRTDRPVDVVVQALDALLREEDRGLQHKLNRVGGVATPTTRASIVTPPATSRVVLPTASPARSAERSVQDDLVVVRRAHAPM